MPMKKILFLVFALSSISALATPLMYDGFDYPLSPTNLTAQGTWQDAANPASITNRPYIVSGNLPTPPGLYPALGNHIHFGGKGMSARNAFSPTVSSGKIYYSFILKITDLGSLTTAGGSAPFFTAITGGTFTGTQEPTLLVAAVVAKKAATGQFVLGVKKASGGITYSTNSAGPTAEIINNVGDVVFVVASYEFVTGPGAGTSDKARIWINPDQSTFGGIEPIETVLSTGSTDISVAGSPLNGVTIFNRQGLFESAAMELDELSVGTTWADVTPTTSTVTLAFTTRPVSQRVVVGHSATFTSAGFRATSYKWQFNGVDIPGQTNKTLTINSAQLSDAGNYAAVIGNGSILVTSTPPAVLTVTSDIFPRLVQLWNIPPTGAGSRPYMGVDGSTQPYVRHFAYNPVSNQILLASRTNTATLSGSGNIYVLNADTGADLWTMDTSGISSSSGAVTTSGVLMLNAINVADDGAVYAGNISDGTFDEFDLYRWNDSTSSSASVKVYAGQPFLSGTRWGDSMAIRNTGGATEILLDNSSGGFGAILESVQSSLSGSSTAFTNLIGGASGGRSLKFDAGTTFWEKHGGPNLYKASYDLTGFTSTVLSTNTFPKSLGVADRDTSGNLLAGIGFASTTSTPDTLDLWDMSDPTQPAIVASYNFPTVNTNYPNGNGCGRVVFAGDRVYALYSNNGLVAYTLVPVLHITLSAPNVVLSWSSETSGYTLQAAPSLAPQTWTNVSSGTLFGSQYFVTNSTDASALFYRLKK